MKTKQERDARTWSHLRYDVVKHVASIVISGAIVLLGLGVQAWLARGAP